MKSGTTAPRPERARCTGFTYIGLLIFIALMGIGLAFAGQVWHTAAQREKEKELLFAGDEFRSAIASYYESSPGGSRTFPRSLEDLLDDRRHPATKRHLRRIYRDPMTNSDEWGLVSAPDGSITGVFSRSEDQPVKLAGFRVRDEMFEGASRYSDWKFAHALPVATKVDEGKPGPASPGQPGEDPQPANPAIGPIVVEPPPKPLSKCERLNAADQTACQGVESRWGAADGDLCRTSAANRLAACIANGPISALYIRYQ